MRANLAYWRSRDGRLELRRGDCRDVLPSLSPEIADAVVTDPPYDLLACSRGGSPRVNGSVMRGFMGMRWDGTGIAFSAENWRQVLRLLKPGGYLLSFGGTRTWHRLACALEEAGYEMRDTICWLHGQGFPKGQGCLKPAFEPIILCRKPGPKVLPLGIDECRIPTADGWYDAPGDRGHSHRRQRASRCMLTAGSSSPLGRWPANVLHDGSEEVLKLFPDQRGGGSPKRRFAALTKNCFGTFKGHVCGPGIGPTAGNAARFFYCAKASPRERGQGNSHPTVKPLKLIEWLVKLICPAGGRVLDPFAGSSTTGLACRRLNRMFVGIEQDQDYFRIGRARLKAIG